MIPNVHKRQRPTPVFKSQKDAPPARSALRIQANRICVRVGFSMFWLLSRTTLSAAGLLLPIRDLTSLNGEEMLGGVSPGEPAKCPGPLPGRKRQATSDPPSVPCASISTIHGFFSTSWSHAHQFIQMCVVVVVVVVVVIFSHARPLCPSPPQSGPYRPRGRPWPRWSSTSGPSSKPAIHPGPAMRGGVGVFSPEFPRCSPTPVSLTVGVQSCFPNSFS